VGYRAYGHRSRAGSEASSAQENPQIRRLRKAAFYTATIVAVLVIAAEAGFWLSGSDRVEGNLSDCVVLVPGYPAKADGTPHAIQRFRVDAAIVVYRQFHCRRMIVSGGAVANRYVEAETMADLASKSGVPVESLIVESNARSTWENVGCARQFFKDSNHVLIVSDPLQAHRAKRYACRQDPQQCSTISAVGVTPPFSELWWSVPLAANEARIKIQDYFAEKLGRLENPALCRRGL
jgi:vancomycin permeability regulator SanA